MSTAAKVGRFRSDEARTTFLAAYVAALGERHPLYAVDTITDAGRSHQDAPVRDGAGIARWLDADVQAEIVPGAGYTIPMEEPARFTSRVLRFVDEVDARSQARSP